MDPITLAIVTALGAGALSGLTEVSKTGITEAYQALKSLLVRKFGKESQVALAVNHLEARHTSLSRQEGLQEELVEVKAEQDAEVLAAAQRLLALLQPLQTGPMVQNNGPVQGQNNAQQQWITQHFGESK